MAGRFTLVLAFGDALHGAGGSGGVCPSRSITRGIVGGPARRCGDPCGPLTLESREQCFLDVAGCESVRAGGACEVRCKVPFVGKPTLAFCPTDNADVTRQPQWQPPECNFPTPTCEEPAVAPTGYEKRPDGHWRCAAAYAGDLHMRCVPDDNCVAKLELSGCKVLQRCVPPEVDRCKVDVSECTGGIWPGDSCLVRCKAPYYQGSTSTAICYPDNTEVRRDLLLVEPPCELNCPDPVDVPLGYERDGAGGWRCAATFGGRATRNCSIDAECVRHVEFSGCAPLANCDLPRLNGSEACMYDFSACVGAGPNMSCQVRCRHPYAGDAVTASCPAGNSDPMQPLLWPSMNCTVQCLEVAPLPDGYVSYPYRREGGAWQCVEGYAGTVSMGCTTDSDCQPQLILEGCKRQVACAPPQLTVHDLCTYNVLACVRVPSGERCTIGCRAPYSGPDVEAECPANNTNPEQQLSWSWPKCELQCPNLEGPQEGYERTDAGQWICAPGYVGWAVATCVVGTDCVGRLDLVGCSKMHRCTLPPIQDRCWMDWSDCQDPVPGRVCQVRCKAPYVGNASWASCPAFNTNSSREISWTEPDCEMSCDDPAGAPGYEIASVECDEGFFGYAAARCTTSQSDCRPRIDFSGCSLSRLCSPPVVDAKDICKLDVSECQEVSPGGTCEVRCAAPFYTGTPTPGFCPTSNIEAGREVLWIRPACELLCPDPDPAPPGYAWGPECGWHCAEGYAGTAEKRCGTGANCSAGVEMHGCHETFPCLPLQTNLSCRLDVSYCANVPPGEHCEVRCKAPYTATSSDPVLASCPSGNTDPAQPLLYPDGTTEDDVLCGLDCPDPGTFPHAYKKDEATGEYLCADGYMGVVQKQCATDSVCFAYAVFDGCLPIIPCRLPDVDLCQFDLSDCGDFIMTGTSCTVRCKSPYVISPGYPNGEVLCPATNTDRSGAIPTLPVCDLGCRETEQQDGYHFTDFTQSWSCASGWIGQTVRQGCRMDDACISYPVLTGCIQLQPCEDLVLTGKDACVVDASECTNVAAGLRCTLRCRWPMVGYFVRAACPSSNVETNTPLNWKLPSCQCQNPNPLPAGYVNDIYGEYYCAEGFLGSAVATCIVNDDCSSYLEFEGCHQRVPCDRFEFDSNESACRYDVSNCTELAPGDTCQVGCLAPYTGNSTQAICPADNTDPAQEPNNLPQCELQCPEFVAPPGYRRGRGWRCAKGYVGNASTYCVNATACTSEVLFTGCEPWVPCALPKVTDNLDGCRLDFSSCVGISPGSYCEVQCKQPFFGEATRALCPPDNVDPTRELVWVKPECDAVWPEPIPPPDGYERRPPCGWTCSSLYFGKAVVKGDADVWCRPRLMFSGCFKTEFCEVRTDTVDPCRIDASDCYVGTVPAGFSCEVRCQAPYYGNASVARCPQDNIVRFGDLTWVEPDCNFDCVWPEPIPDGYVKSGDTWTCALHYLGTALVRCVSDSTCSNSSYVFSGCTFSPPCLPIEGEDPCKLNVSDCSRVWPGSTCKVECNPPYFGEAEVASCPAGNLDPARSLEWRRPLCEPECPAPDPWPRAYTKDDDGWRCSDDATGTALPRCFVSWDCKVQLSLLGCFLLQPCLVPQVDRCRMNVSACENLPANGTCSGFCREPFLGDAFNGTCPAENTDALKELEWFEAPSCMCPPPDLVPPGYVKDDTGGWACAPGYTGSAKFSCINDADCQPDILLWGCVPVVGCGVPNPSYFGNRSQCNRMSAGESCMVDCIDTPCVSGGPLEFRCPLLNAIGDQEPLLISGHCETACESCEALNFWDTNPRQGVIAGTVRFGPAQAQGSTQLPDVLGYHVVFADSCGKQLVEPLAFVEQHIFTFQCCAPDAFQVTLEPLEMPDGAVSLAILVVTKFGVLPHGRTIPLQDLVESNTGPTAAVSTTAPQLVASVLALALVTASLLFEVF